MKQINYIILVLIAFIASGLQGQRTLELTFKKHKNDTDVTSLSYDQKIMDVIKTKDKAFKTKITKVEILAFDPKKDFSKSDLTKINKSIEVDQYDMLVNAKSKGNTFKLYGQSKGDILQSVYGNANTSEGNVHFLLIGNIHLEELSQMGLDFEGAEVFKMLGKDID